MQHKGMAYNDIHNNGFNMTKRIGTFQEYLKEQRQKRLNETSVNIECEFWDLAIVEVLQDLENEVGPLYTWEGLIRFVEIKNSILGRLTPEIPDDAVLMHIKELIFWHHGDSVFSGGLDWRDWDNTILHSKGVVFEELAATILEKVREKTDNQNQSMDTHITKLMDKEPIIAPCYDLEDDFYDDLPFEQRRIKGLEEFSKMHNEAVSKVKTKHVSNEKVK